jgi:hypothetical protein
MATFTATIELGNQAMQTGNDIRDALQSQVCRADAIGSYDPTDTRLGANEGIIRDANGNTVGTWQVREDGN